MSNSETIIGRIIIFKTILLNQGEYINNWQGSFVLHQISPFYLCLLIYLRFIVIDLSVNVYPVCNNKDCKKKINGNPGSRVVKCMACNKSMLVKNCYLDMNVNFQLDSDNNSVSVTAFPKVITAFLNEDIYSYRDDTDGLIEKLLLLECVDFHLSQKMENWLRKWHHITHILKNKISFIIQLISIYSFFYL